MILGSLIDSGAISFEALWKELKKLPLNFRIKKSKVLKNSISATKFDVYYDHGRHSHKKLKDIISVINRSKLKPAIKENSKKVFINLANAEAKVHGINPAKVSFHEVGDIDSIVDIVGIVAAFEIIGIDEFYISELKVGKGFIKSGHGTIPSPGPAALELLKEMKFSVLDINHELITPTAAAIFKTFCKKNDSAPSMSIKSVGYGAGLANFDGISNVLRIIIGEASAGIKKDSVVLLEANIDDMPPFFYQNIFEKLFYAGALDVYASNILMKKMRPAVKLSVLCKEDILEKITKLLFDETTTVGVRFNRLERFILDRKIIKVKTSLGNVKVKIAGGGETLKKIIPEYEDCLAISKKNKIPFIKAYSQIVSELKAAL